MLEPQLEKPWNFDVETSSYGGKITRSMGMLAPTYDSLISLKARHLIELCRRHGDELRDLPVLDFGCGNGDLDYRLQQDFNRLHGSDLSEKSLQVAKKRNPRVIYQIATPTHLPYPESHFAMIFAWCVFHHIEPEDRVASVRRLSTLLRPGGLLIIVEHNPFNPLTRLAVNRCEFDRGVKLISKYQLGTYLTEAKLKVAESGYSMFFPWEYAPLQRLEDRLRGLPLGGQHYAVGRKTGHST